MANLRMDRDGAHFAARAMVSHAVLAAYGFSAKKDLLEQILDWYHDLAAKSENGEPVGVPGVPKNHAVANKLVTEDCIRVAGI